MDILTNENLAYTYGSAIKRMKSSLKTTYFKFYVLLQKLTKLLEGIEFNSNSESIIFIILLNKWGEEIKIYLKIIIILD